jgi:hypothetical protein
MHDVQRLNANCDAAEPFLISHHYIAITTLQTLMSNTQKPEVPWAEGDAKHILKKELKKGTIPLNADEMAPRVVYMQHPEFADYPYEQFRDRLNDLRNKIKKKKACSTFDTYALERDQKSHPKPVRRATMGRVASRETPQT